MSPRSASKSGPSAIVLLLLGIVALAVGWTAMNYRGGLADDADSSDREHATATVNECREVGPVSLSGVGYWWQCTISVTPEDGEAYQQVFNGSQFEPSDVGKEFPLVSAGQSSSTWSRADIPGNNWAITVTAVGLLAGGIMLVMAVRKVMRR